MPLVVPGLSGGADKNGDWMNKLMGKKLTDSKTDHGSFSKKELPANHRVVEGDSMMTMDHNPDRSVTALIQKLNSSADTNDRMNVHVDKDGTIKNVKWG